MLLYQYAAAVFFTPSLAGRNLYEISPKSYLVPVLNGSTSEGKRMPARNATRSFAKVTCTIFMPVRNLGGSMSKHAVIDR